MAAQARSLPPEADSILRALRYRGDELQWGRVLHGVLQEPKSASAFLRGALDCRYPPLGGARRKIRVPDELRCRSEAWITAALPRARAHRRARELGRVDLLFTGPRFRLIVELKLDSRFGPGQIRRYVQEGARVLAIVRDPQSALAAAGHPGSGWLGACAWADMLPGLRELPLAPAIRPLWRAVIDVCERGGDFARERPVDPGVARAQRLMEGLRVQTHKHVRKRLSSRYSRAFADTVDVEDQVRTELRPGWAYFSLQASDDYPVTISLRDGESSSPLLRVDWKPPISRSGQRALRAAHQRLTTSRQRRWQRRHTAIPLYSYEARVPVPIQERAGSQADSLWEELRSWLDQLVRAGVFDWDAEAL